MTKKLRAFEIIEPNQKKRTLRASDGTIITCLPYKEGLVILKVLRPWAGFGGVYTKQEADKIFSTWLNPKLRENKVKEAFDRISKAQDRNKSIFKRVYKWLMNFIQMKN